MRFAIRSLSLGLSLCLSLGICLSVGFIDATVLASEQSTNEAASIILKRTSSLQELIKDNQSESDWYKVNKVNYFFNQKIKYQEDMPLYNEQDYWATVNETLNIGKGDCEDYVIAKFFSLRQLNVDESKLRLMYVRHLTLNQPHMVLLYFDTPSAMPLVLDNFNPELLPISKRADLKPIYSFNNDGVWMVSKDIANKRDIAENYTKKVVNSPGVSKWDDLLQRMALEKQKWQLID